MVIVDTDVLLLAFAFHRDERQEINQQFFRMLQYAEPATTIYNLMEFIGQMSFNLAPSRLTQWRTWLVDEFNLTILFPEARRDQTADSFYRTEIFEQAFVKISREKMAYQDALILDLAERTLNVEFFVTWNAKHFKNKSSLAVVTPAEYLHLMRGA